MKKTKLLTSLAALALVVGLGACSELEVEEPSDDTGGVVDTETDEDTESSSDTSSGENDDGSNDGKGGDTIISEDVEDALSLLATNGADTSSWSGVNYHDYLDMSESMYSGLFTLDLQSFDETVLATEKDGVVMGLDEDLVYLYGELDEDYSEYEFYDGTSLFSLENGELSSETVSLSLSYFTDYPLYIVEYDIETFAELAGLTTLYELLMGYKFEGSITQLEDGNLEVFASYSLDDYYYEGYDEDYGDAVLTDSVSIEVVYDANGCLVSLNCDIYEEEYYPSLSASLIYVESTTCSDFAGTIDTPDWVSQE